ncbi:MAG: DUF4251 domain-containing protein [Bacteroidales bacterium]|jgi:hypothetical protein|nr:DUF4251 domain-containing protein [Bacteroidales bacterium]
MKKIAASVILVLFTIAAMAQNNAPLSRLEKKTMKVEQKKQTEIMLSQTTANALRSGCFVLKADQVRGRGGYAVNVNPTINFVAVEGEDAYFQLASSSGIGFNGLGGITLRGRITSFKMDQGNKHGGYNIIMNTIGTGGNLTIMMSVNKTGEMASAMVSNNWGNRVDLNGSLVPWTGTGKEIFKGRETF